jgi:hypothetical protein
VRNDPSQLGGVMSVNDSHPACKHCSNSVLNSLPSWSG